MANSAKWPVAMGIMVIVLVGCNLYGGNDTRSDSARDDLAARLAETQQAQAAALTLWDRLIFGEQVSCEEVVPVPGLLTLSKDMLKAHPQADAIQTRINEAITALRASADLWNLECANEQVVVSLAIAREGRATALTASEPLNDAATLLAEWVE